jgi:hypothetical protein
MKRLLPALLLVALAACAKEDTGATASDTIEPGSGAEAVSTDTRYGSTGGGTDPTGTAPMSTDTTASETIGANRTATTGTTTATSGTSATTTT